MTDLANLNSQDNLEIIIQEIPGYDPYANINEDTFFDSEAAQTAINFIEIYCRHFEGRVGGKPFILERWQKAIVANIFGWKTKSEFGEIIRRYREVFIYVGRKNGKSPLAVAITNAKFFLDDELGQQIYLAASERGQADIIFRHIIGMIQQEKDMDEQVKIYKTARSITREQEGSFIKVISAKADSKFGFNPSMCVIDELHVQRNRDLVDALESANVSANRNQSMILYTTTADYARESICNEKYNYACKVRDGVIVNQTFLPVIFACNEENWEDENEWKKANPNIGVSVSLTDLRKAYQKTKDTPSYENTFKREHLNIITEQDVRWISLADWDKCYEEYDVKSLEGRPCFSGLDLSKSNDISALVLCFPPLEDGEKYILLPFFWVPGDSMVKREKENGVPYPKWQKDKLIEPTTGNTVDYSFIRKKINELAAIYDIKKIAFDPWNARELSTQLMNDDGLPMEEFRQGFKSFAEPCQRFEQLVISGKINHLNNPVLKWMISNVVCEVDPAGNVKPNKAKSNEKIDGIVASIMALGLSMQNPYGLSTGGLMFISFDSDSE